jgi:asparagine synthase (glutamine-hydrolysing)
VDERMSGIAAVFGREGGAPHAEFIGTILDAMSERGRDGRAWWRDAPIVLGSLRFQTTQESLAERQPRFNPRTGCVIVLDGRIDNRDDTINALVDRLGPDESDAAIVLAAYEQWGTDSPSRLLGDFAFVIWDPRVQQLFAARDVMGVRPLCYAQSRDGELIVASELRGILATGAVDDSINEARVLEHLADRAQHREETLYRHIRRLPPAHIMLATRERIQIRRYWDFDSVRSIRYRRDDDYAAHLRELLTRAIRAQSRSIGPLGLLLSGGLDSSSIAAIAAAEGIRCEAFSVGYPARPYDERIFAEMVARHCCIPFTMVSHVSRPAREYEHEVRTYRDLPQYPNGATLDRARRHAAAAGVRVLLTGAGGDEWFTGSPFQYADWIHTGNVWRLGRAFGSDIGRRGLRAALRRITLSGVWPLLPPSGRQLVKTFVPRRDGLPDWIPDDVVGRVDLASRIAARVVPRGGETFCQADIRDVATSGFLVHSEELEDRAASRAGVEQRNPFYDRRIIEFAFALPEEQRSRGGGTKYVLRRAVAGLLPDAVRMRRDKAEFSELYVDAIQGWAQLVTPHLVSRGWIVPGALERMCTNLLAWRAASDSRYYHMVDAVWIALALECWFAERQKRANSVSEAGVNKTPNAPFQEISE